MADKNIFELRGKMEAAIDAGFADWEAGRCQEPGCGCVTEYVKRRVLAALDAPIETGKVEEGNQK